MTNEALALLASQLETLNNSVRERFTAEREATRAALDETERLMRSVESHLDALENYTPRELVLASIGDESIPLPELEPIRYNWQVIELEQLDAARIAADEYDAALGFPYGIAA